MKKLSRKEQRVKSQREYERKMALLDKQLRAAQKAAQKTVKAAQVKTRKDLAKLRKQVREEKKRVERITYKDLIRQGVDGAPIKPLLQKLSRNLRAQATREIITGRLNRAANVYDDVRTEAWDIAEDLDWDISEVFNAWDYDDTA
jgi:hypothetical protein